jgi:hypothetical protein
MTSPAPRSRPHHGTVPQQIEALERLATETAVRLEDLYAAFSALRGADRPRAEPEPTWPPPGYPPSPKQARRHGLRAVRSP